MLDRSAEVTQSAFLGVQESTLHRSLWSRLSVALLYHRHIVTVGVTGFHS